MSRTVDKYLSRHAEPEIEVAPDGEWDHAIVIPACGEGPRLLEGLAAAREGRRVLVVLVVNAIDSHAAEVHRANEDLLAALQSGDEGLLVLDRASKARRLPAPGGVGLARKIGFDAVLRLRDRVSSRWIHTTDADARLPRDFFEADAEGATAMVRRFRHTASGDDVLDDAHTRYEIRLRYYVLGLRWAGSPYAFHTIGSILSADREGYAAVHGMPKREAGEDFYLLNKLAKLGPVHRANTAPVEIRSRRSLRVPFGTGPAVERLMSDPEGPKLYDPRCFAVVRDWLAVLGRTVEARSFDVAGFEALPEEARAHIDPEPALRLVREQGGDSLRRQLHVWFDGFRTLKLIHSLRDSAWPDVPWERALQAASFCGSFDGAADAALAGLTALDEVD